MKWASIKCNKMKYMSINRCTLNITYFFLDQLSATHPECVCVPLLGKEPSLSGQPASCGCASDVVADRTHHFQRPHYLHMHTSLCMFNLSYGFLGPSQAFHLHLIPRWKFILIMWLCKQIYVHNIWGIHIPTCAFTTHTETHKSLPHPLVKETAERLWMKREEEWSGINGPCTMTLNKMSESIQTHLNPSSWVPLWRSIIPALQKIPLNGEPQNGVGDRKQNCLFIWRSDWSPIKTSEGKLFAWCVKSVMLSKSRLC